MVIEVVEDNKKWNFEDICFYPFDWSFKEAENKEISMKFGAQNHGFIDTDMKQKTFLYCGVKRRIIDDKIWLEKWENPEKWKYPEDKTSFLGLSPTKNNEKSTNRTT